MKPYYTFGDATIYHADMRDVVLPDADLVLTDPPFAEETHSGARTNPNWNISGGNHPPEIITFDSVTADELREMFNLVCVRAKRWTIATMDYKHVVAFEQTPPTATRFVRFGIWRKPNGAPQFTGDRPATGWEGIAMMHRAGCRMRWNGGGKHGVYEGDEYTGADWWRVNKMHHAHKIGTNKTSKPPALWAALMQDFSDAGDLVLDPFMGDGTTVAVALLLGRKVVAVEKNERHCEDLASWLEAGNLETWRKHIVPAKAPEKPVDAPKPTPAPIPTRARQKPAQRGTSMFDDAAQLSMWSD